MSENTMSVEQDVDDLRMWGFQAVGALLTYGQDNERVKEIAVGLDKALNAVLAEFDADPDPAVGRRRMTGEHPPSAERLRYNTVVVDPPWPITMAGRRKREDIARCLPYQTMSLPDIEAFPLADYAEQGAHVYMWATNKTLHDAFHVLEAWGVSPHLTLVMAKKSGIAPAMGYVFATEFCILGFYGRPMQPFRDIGALNWLVTNPQSGRHSRKPDAFYDLVERMSPPPYIDLFARRCRLGWSVWGNEVPS